MYSGLFYILGCNMWAILQHILMFTLVGQFITCARITVTEIGGNLKQVCMYVKTFVLKYYQFLPACA